MKETVVLLHGFGGTGRVWDPVIAALPAERYRPSAPDLRGHGSASSRRPIGVAECVADVAALAPARFILCGYSMGGRIAQHVALAHPGRVSRLVLVSTTAGIDDPDERAARRAADRAIADGLERDGLERFADAWARQPLFAGDAAEVRAAARVDQMRNRAADLAAAMRGVGTGEMSPLWGRLGELRMPVEVIAGARDEKFVELGARLSGAIADATLTTVPGAGHYLPFEAPAAIAAAIHRPGPA